MADRLEVRGELGLEVVGVHVEEGELVVRVLPGEVTATTAALALLAEGEEVARVDVAIEARAEEPEEPEAASSLIFDIPPPRPALEGSSLLLRGGSVGVRDEQRWSTGSNITIGYEGEGGDTEAALVVSGGLRAVIVPERLRLDLGIHVASDGAGDGGLWAGLAGRVLNGPMVGLAVEVAAWIPLQTDADVGYAVRVAPSVDLSVRPGDRTTVRTRQGALIDLASRGERLWSSAYGVDLRLRGPLGVGLEAILLVGTDRDDQTVVAPALAAGLSVHLSFLDFSISGRASLNDDSQSLLGQFAVIAAARVRVVPRND